MLFSNLLSTLILSTTVFAGPIAKPSEDVAQLEKQTLVERSGGTTMSLPDGNQCELTVSSGPGTAGWNSDDYARLYEEAARAMTSSIALSNRPAVGLTTSFRDHFGVSHTVDCELTTTGEAYVDVGGANQNMNQAMVSAEGLADNGWPTLLGTSRSTFWIWFGDVIAISIAVNVLD
jgi:hypothetical protein